MDNVKINGLATAADMQFYGIEGGFGKKGGELACLSYQ